MLNLCSSCSKKKELPESINTYKLLFSFGSYKHAFKLCCIYLAAQTIKSQIKLVSLLRFVLLFGYDYFFHYYNYVNIACI